MTAFRANQGADAEPRVGCFKWQFGHNRGPPTDHGKKERRVSSRQHPRLTRTPFSAEKRSMSRTTVLKGSGYDSRIGTAGVY